MLYGTVHQFFPGKGYGFIRPDVGPDVFFHITALGACQPQQPIEVGQAVKYELVPGTRPKFGGRTKRRDEDAPAPEKALRPEAKLVELIDKIPGATLDKASQRQKAARHPLARRKKPSWRR